MDSLFQCLTTLCGTAFFLRFNRHFCWWHLGPLPFTFSLCPKKNLSLSSYNSRRALTRLPLYRLNKQGPSITSSCVMYSTILVALQWIHSGMSMSLLYWEALNCTQYIRCGLVITKYMRKTTSFDLLGALFPIHHKMWLAFITTGTEGSHSDLLREKAVVCESNSSQTDTKGWFWRKVLLMRAQVTATESFLWEEESLKMDST